MKTKLKQVPGEDQSSEDQSSSDQIVASIDDLLTQILLCLPIRSLIRFKSISKHWNSIITNPHFCFMRNSYNPDPPVGLILSFPAVRHTPKYEFIPFSGIESTIPSFVSDPRKMSVAHSCNGLLLCYTCQLPDHEYEYYICNPTTNQISPLPKPYQGSEWSMMSLAFDPAKSPYYKVVCADNLSMRYGMLPRHKYQFLVYSSEWRVWNKCGEPFINNGVFENGVCWNGALHWIESHVTGGFMYFNFEDQIVREMPTPPHSYFRWGTCLRESRDCLHFINEKSPEPERVLVVYEMKRDYSEWFIKYIVDVSLVEAAYPGMVKTGINPLYAYYIFSLIRGEKDEDSFLVLKIEGKLIRYNIVDKTFEIIYRGDKVRGSSRYFDLGFQYIESLCCV